LKEKKEELKKKKKEKKFILKITFNVKLYTTFNLLFIIFFFQNNLQK
jgi:hypothetical protein